MIERVVEFLLEREELTQQDIAELVQLTNNELMKQLFLILKNLHHKFSSMRTKTDSQANKIIRQILVILEMIYSTEDTPVTKSLKIADYTYEIDDELDYMMGSWYIDTKIRIEIYFYYKRILREDNHLLISSPIFGYTVMDEDFLEHMIFLRTKYSEQTGIRTEKELLKHLREKLSEIVVFTKKSYWDKHRERYLQKNGLIPLLCGSLKSKAKSLVPLLCTLLRERIFQQVDHDSVYEMSAELRICTAWALKEINGEEAIDALIKGMRNEFNVDGTHPTVVCAWVLGELSAEKAVKSLFYAKHYLIGRFYEFENPNRNEQLSTQTSKSLQKMGILDDGLEYIYDGIHLGEYDFEQIDGWILRLGEDSILEVKRKLLESDSKEILEDSWLILIIYYEWKRLSNDDLKKEIFELLDKRKELLPILNGIIIGARNGIWVEIKNLLKKYKK